MDSTAFVCLFLIWCSRIASCLSIEECYDDGRGPDDCHCTDYDQLQLGQYPKDVQCCKCLSVTVTRDLKFASTRVHKPLYSQSRYPDILLDSMLKIHPRLLH